MASKRSVLKKIRLAGADVPDKWEDLVTAAHESSRTIPETVVELTTSATTQAREILNTVARAQSILTQDTPTVGEKETSPSVVVAEMESHSTRKPAKVTKSRSRTKARKRTSTRKEDE